jgi:upstream activation factor subunit UAF30
MEMTLENFNTLVDRVKLLEDKLSQMDKLVRKVNRQEKQLKNLHREIMPESEQTVRKPSGFAKETWISDDLCTFLGVPVGTQKSRTDVTKFITAYIKEHDLQNKENRKFVNMDDKLNVLLKPTGPVSYFDIQKLLKVHYQKPETAESAAPAVEASAPPPTPAAKKRAPKKK